MAVLVAFFKNSAVPATGLSPLPTIDVFDADTPAAAVASGSMYEIGGGGYGFVFAPSDGTNYIYVCDGGSGVVDVSERTVEDVISGTTVARIETDIPAILVDTATMIPAAVAVVDSNVDAILVDTGTTIPGTIATLQVTADAILVDTGTTIPAALVDILTDTGTTIPGLIATVDTNVDAILVDTSTTLPSSIAGIPALVWAEDLTGFVSAFTSAGDMLNACRQRATNRFEASAGAPGATDWYLDDGTTIRVSATLTDATGAAVVAVAGVPARIGAFV